MTSLNLIAAIAILLVLTGCLYLPFYLKARRRRGFTNADFPEGWRSFLHDTVSFYRSLDAKGQARFETDVLRFLSDIRISGIGSTVEDKDRLLVAASAVIPIFGFPEWEYTNLNEVLLYPNSFNEHFETAGEDRRILGMVGSGAMNNVMILSKPALHAGFAIDNDKKNVGIHEFVHLLDKADGTVDGIPGELAAQHYTLPWLDLIHRKMEEIHSGASDIDSYGAVSRVEFFAVASEYFFERPDLLQSRHPELYRRLSRVFRQDLAGRLLHSYRSARKIGRNAPCPCGSGQKFKRCCGKQ